jgi:hypothetical protein
VGHFQGVHGLSLTSLRGHLAKTFPDLESGSWEEKGEKRKETEGKKEGERERREDERGEGKDKRDRTGWRKETG